MEEILGVLPQEAMSVLDQRLEKKTTCRVFSCQWWAMGVPWELCPNACPLCLLAPCRATVPWEAQ